MGGLDTCDIMTLSTNYINELEGRDMGKEWKVKDVMSYYGEHFANEIEVQDAMDEVRRRSTGWGGKSYGEKMRLMREYLKEQFGIETVFVIGYRRAK